MGATSYSTSWLYGEFRIARLYRGRVENHWEAPEPVESEADLALALAAAAKEIDLSVRGDVTFVHEHDLQSHDYLEIPLMKKRDLEKYLQRRVNQDKTFEDEAAWCYHRVKHGGGKQGVLLHLLPKRLVDSTVSACTDVGLAPKKYVPLTEIVSAHMPRLGLKADSLTVVVACFKTRTEIVLVMGNGEVLFVRELSYGRSNDTLDRLIIDINRTIRYTRQQLGRGVDSTRLMGDLPEDAARTLADGIETEVVFDEEARSPYFWAERGDQLTGRLSANFISAFTQNNLTIDVARRFGVWLMASTITAAVLITLFIGALVAERSERIVTVTAHTHTVEEKIHELENKLELGRSKQDHLTRLQASSHNLPSLLMVHLSKLAPNELSFTNVRIVKATSGWEVALTGRISGSLRNSARILARFEETLSSAPWYLKLDQSFTQSWMEQFSQGKLPEDDDLRFLIKGQIK